MEFENNEAALYFSFFTSATLDKKHELDEETRERALTAFASDVVPLNFDEYITAIVGCKAMGSKRNEDRISKKSIDEYFLGPHNIHSDCKAYEGKVANKKGSMVEVATPVGERDYLALGDYKVGDIVIVHGNYALSVRK